MITTHYLFFFTGFSSGGAEEEVPVVRRPGAGRSRRRRRYEFPNGMHAYATPEEAQAIAEEFFTKAPTAVVEKKKKKLVIPEIHIVLDDGQQPYVRPTKQKETDVTDAFIAFTQRADLEAIVFENIVNQLRRRRRVKAILLAS